ncbi:glycosyltransferase family 2 protein [Rhodohalobacter barkolensis]|uniref:Glycosyl transferase n=1 Tax=Rhodohalobacter barkolensis TaxID=2053187 RepID=A0A2N0VEI8_9BACT|nr:glycosyltransferase [Rhodohalobacter barkolensis]PKD42615.1 glycosyl transferase [Rhodohalobacter barkolensis]
MLEQAVTHIQQFINLVDSLGWVFILYFLIVNGTYLSMVVVSLFYIRKHQKYYSVFEPEGVFQSDLYKSISIISPAYNEEVNIIDSVEALLQLQYRDFEVVVVNDGSTDSTLEKLKNHFRLYESEIELHSTLPHKNIVTSYRSSRYDNLIVIDKVNGGKGDALNCGINACANDLFCSIDADSLLEQDVLKQMLQAFVLDDRLVAAGGIVRVANGCKVSNYEIKEIGIPKSFLARIQTVEYLRSFLFGRIGWDYFKSLIIISGAFGIFDRKSVIRAGGYARDSVGEDMELVVRLHRFFREQDEEYRVRFLPKPVCWTEVPENWNDLATQRNRWQRGLVDSIWRHRTMFFNKKYGRMGLTTIPYFTLVELIGPVIEMMGYIYFIFVIIFMGIYEPFVLLFLTVSILLGFLLSVSSLICEEATFRRYGSIKNTLILTLYASLENLGYRQIHAWWRFVGLIDYIKGKKSWGKMNRLGFERDDEAGKKAQKPKSEFLPKLRSSVYWAIVFLMPPGVIYILFNFLYLN